MPGKDEIELWGSGTPLREFLHADDLADALIFLMERYSDHDHVNVGSGKEISIRDLAEAIATAAGFGGRIALDPSKPDGTPRKLMDSSRLLGMGWQPRIDLDTGLARTIREFEALHATDGRVKP